MVIKTSKGYYEVLKNIRDALNIEKFEEAYLEEYYDTYEYIVGDIASEILRLKGFNKADGSFNTIPEYLAESCVFKCAFFILRRINEDEYNKLSEYYKNHPNNNLTVGDDHVEPMPKVNYDKESLVLESTKKNTPNIVLDMNRINKVKTFPLPDDLKDDKEDIRDYRRGGNNNHFQNNNNNQNRNQNQRSNNNQNNGQRPNQGQRPNNGNLGNQRPNQNQNQKNNNQNRPNNQKGQNNNKQMNNNSFKNNNHHKNRNNKGGASNGQ